MIVCSLEALMVWEKMRYDSVWPHQSNIVGSMCLSKKRYPGNGMLMWFGLCSFAALSHISLWQTRCQQICCDVATPLGCSPLISDTNNEEGWLHSIKKDSLFKYHALNIFTQKHDILKDQLIDLQLNQICILLWVQALSKGNELN